MKNCAKARDWYIASVMKNLPSDKEEGVRFLPFPEGEMVNAKFEAHIIRTDGEPRIDAFVLHTFPRFHCVYAVEGANMLDGRNK